MTKTISTLVERSMTAWFADVPVRRHDLVRRLTFGYAAAWLVIRARYVWDVAHLPERRFEPVGVLAAFDAPPSRALVVAVWGIALVASCLAVRRRAPRFTEIVGAVAMLFVATFTSSFGQVFHTEHLLVLHLLVLGVASEIHHRDAGDVRSGWPLRLMAAVVVTAYVVAGIAKVRLGGSGWLDGVTLQRWVAVDNLRKLLLEDPYSAVGGWLASVSWVWAPIALVTLAVELGAPLAMIGRRTRLVWIGLAWVFHVAVLALMAISFPYQLSGVAYLAFLPVERIERRIRHVIAQVRSFRPRSSASKLPANLEVGVVEFGVVE